MAAVDYEAAWVDLLARVASRPGWGSKALLAEAATIAAEHRVPEDLVQRVVRIYGADTLSAVVNPSGSRTNAGGGQPTDPRALVPATQALGEHDGSQHQHPHPR